jgi:thioredoxin-related protein
MKIDALDGGAGKPKPSADCICDNASSSSAYHWSMKAIKPYLPPIILIVVAAAIYFVPPLLEAKEIIPWRLDPTTAIAEARAKNQPAFLYFTATWCGPCQSLKHTTWADPAVAKALSSYVPIKIDVDQFRDLARQYVGDGIPHFVIVGGDGKTLREFSGALNSKEFLDWLNGKVIG